jgi:hypothetical protein
MATPSNKELLGDPESSPFVRYDHGTPLYPPNDVYECAQTVLNELKASDVNSTFEKLIQRGSYMGQYGVLPQSTWFAVLGSFFHYRTGERPDMAGWMECCLAGLRLMMRRPHQEAWPDLKEFLSKHIDDISGWTKSWRQVHSKELEIFSDEDGNYYRRDEDGVLFRVLGAKTLDETRLDFITDQLLVPYGFPHQFLALFSLFAITDDFTLNRSAYPPAMKAQITMMEHGRIQHGWHFVFQERTRSFRWRPNSNMCDPLWLSSDLLASMTDTLQVDYFRKRIDTRTADDIWMNGPEKFQVDYVIDSAIRIGNQDEVYLKFEDLTVRWINGTAERDAIVSIPVQDNRSHDEAEVKLDRLLTIIAWEHKHAVRKTWGVAGHRKPFPVVYSPRMRTGIQIDPQYLWNDFRKPKSDEGWLALALYREALNSGSHFYGFLSYYKVIDVLFPKPLDKKGWINGAAARKSHERTRVEEILQIEPDLDEFLRKERLNAIKHVLHRPFLNPDDPKDQRSIAADVHLMKDFATMAIEERVFQLNRPR